MDTVAEIYTFIGQRVIDSIPEEWLRAVVNMESIGNHVKSYGSYETLDNKQKNLPIKLGFEGAKKVLKLKKITTENEKNKWNRAVFSLTPDGEFDMEFIWDQALQDEVESFTEE